MYNIIKAFQILLHLYHSTQQSESLCEEMLLTTYAANWEIYFKTIFIIVLISLHYKTKSRCGSTEKNAASFTVSFKFTLLFYVF